MTEHSFIRSVHRLLPKDMFAWKIHDRFCSGVADAYYSSDGGDLWIEYKFEKLPKRETSKVPIDLSEQQRDWLTARYNEGRHVRVVIGSDKGCVMLDTPAAFAETHMSLATFLSSCVDKKTIVAYILQSVRKQAA
jgi:hypothetical protein